jgi:hypothetical protein
MQSSRPQQNKHKLSQGTQQRTKEHPERRNPARNCREIHGNVTRQSQLKHTGDTQEIPK